jgi:hypothetical protein
MPWKECLVMEECLRFIARRLDGEAMSEVPPTGHACVLVGSGDIPSNETLAA